MGWLDDYEAAAGVQAKPQEPAKAAGGFLDEYDAARPVGLLEGAGQVGSKFGRGLAETAASAIQGVGIGLEATGATSMSGANLGQQAQDFAAQVREYAAQALPEVERLRDSFLLSSAPEALGSAVGFLLPGGWLKAAGVPAWATTMGLGAAVQGASQFEDARMHGASEEDQWKAYLLGGFVGTSEVLPLSRILTRADKASGGTLREALVHGLIEGGEEFLQESGTQLASNAIASHVLAYDEDRKILEDVLANGTAGGFAGIVLSALASASAHSLGKKQDGKLAPSDGGATDEAEGRAVPEVLPSSEGATGPAVQVGPSEASVLPAVPEGDRPGEAPESGGAGVGAPVPPDADQRGGQAPEAEAGTLPPVPGAEDVGLPPSSEGGGEGAGGAVVRGEGEAEGGGVPVRPAPSGGAAGEEAPARGADGGTYAHTEEPASNSSVQPGDELGPVEVRPIEGLREFNPGKRAEEWKVREIMQEMVKGRPLPPVIASEGKPGEPLTIDDGSHRIEAARRLGYTSVPVRVVKPKTAKVPSAPEEPRRARTADVVDSMRQIVTEFERDVGLEDSDELPAALQLADRVLAQRAAAGKKSELDDALADLLKAVRVSPEEEFGSRRERASTDYMQAALKQAKAMLGALDKVKADVSEQRRRAGDQPGPAKEPGRAVAPAPVPDAPAPAAPARQKREATWAELPRPKSLVLGGPADIELASGKTLPAHYALVEADDLIPSHDARRGFARNAAGDLNERDYADPVEGRPFRETVERIAKDLKRRILLSDTPTPTDGPPIVTSKGVVLGGNARAQGIQLAYARGTAQQGDFGDAVRQVAIERGVPVPRNSRHPVLVRVVAEGSEGAPGELSRILNESLTTAKGATAEAVSRGALVNPQAATEIAGALGGGTLRDALGDPSRAKTILRALVSSGAFTQGDLVELTDPTKGTPTQAGKQVIEDALLGAVITDVRVLSETPPAVRQTIIRALPALVRIKVHHPAIAGVITRAAQGMATLKESGQPLADALGQQTLPGVDVGWKGDRLAVAIMRSMVDEAPTKVAAHFQEAAERIEDYAGGQASLFTGEDLAPAQRLEREFGVTQAEKAGLAKEQEDIDDEPSDSAIVADPGELPPEMLLGYPSDPVQGGGANIGAPIGGRLLGSLKPAPSVKGKVSLPEIVEALSKVVEAAGGKTPIRWGRLGVRNARGVFKVGPEVIRVKQANNVSTAAHEVGHALEKHLLGWQAKGPWRKPLVTREQQKELVDLGKALYGNTKPQGGYKREGFAEFVRLYTMEPPSAASSAPKFHAWFEAEFLKDRPKVKAELLRVRELAETWRLQGSVARAEASIVEPTSAKEKLKRARAQYTVNAAIEAFVEVGRPLNELAREAERRMGRMLTPKEDPFLLFQALRSTHSARTKQMIESGMIDLAGNPVGPALEQIRPLVKGRYQDFLLYLWGKRAVALITDPKGGREPGLSIQDARELVSEFDSPEFQRAAQMVYNWSDGVLNYAAQASPDMALAVEKIRDRDPGAYIPLQREFDELDSIWGEAKRARGVGSGGGSVAKRLKGSGRRIKNPFPVLLSNAERTVLAAHRRMVFDSIFKLSRIEGLGHMVEEVPVDQVPHAVNLEQIVRALQKTRPDLLSEEHQPGVMHMGADDLAGEVLTFFSPAQFPKGQDPVLPRWVDGQVKWYRLNHKVASLLAGMDVYRLPKVADLVLGVPARAMRLGTTGLRASFGLITNPIRDFQVLYQNSRSSAWAPRLFLEWVRQVGLAGLHHASGGKWTSPYIQAFLDLGGEMAQPLGQDMDHTARAARRLFQGQTVRVVDPRNLLDFVRQLLQFPETAARVAELKLLAKDIGWEPGQPMSFDQSLRLLMAAKQVTVDFTAAGSLGRVMNQIAPFHNAPIQGARGTVRAARNKPGRWLFRGLQITAASLALWWLNKDEEWYRELDARGRALFWAIPFQWNGKEELALIPKAQEGPQFFGSLPEALADAWYRQDPRGAREFFGVLFDTMAPNVWPVAVEEAYEQRGNEDRFWGTPIVPQGELRRPPEEQAGEYTSEVAKFLGELFGRSPRRIDHAIRGVFGGVAADVIDAVGLGGRAQKSGELSDALVLGKLFQRGGPLGVRPRSINELYDEIERADKVQASVRVEETPGQRQRRLMLEDAGQAVSALSYVRTQTSDNDQRRELTRKMVEISQRALEDAAKGAAPRGPMQQERKRAERLEKELKQR